jgi:hypothetical protein
MNDAPMTARLPRRPLRRATAFVAAAAALSGGCYQSVSAGLGGGRVNGDKGSYNAGAVAAGGAYDFGPARVGLGFVPLGPGFSYGPEVRTEICLRSRRPEKTVTGTLLPNCVSDLVRDTLNLRIAWLPNSWFEDSPEDAPELAGYDNGFSVHLGLGRDVRAPVPSGVVRTMQYFNYGGGLFYTQRSFDGRSSDWIVGAYTPRPRSALDYLELLSGAATRGAH